VEVLAGLFFPTDSKRQPRTMTWPVRRLKCQQNHRGIWNGRSVRWPDRFTTWNSDGITEGLEMADLYGDVSMFPSESPMESPTDFPLVLPSEKVNICPLCRPSPPLFLLLLSNPNSPHLQTTSPPNKNLPHLSTTSYISWSFVVTTSMFWFTDGFYQFL